MKRKYFPIVLGVFIFTWAVIVYSTTRFKVSEGLVESGVSTAVPFVIFALIYYFGSKNPRDKIAEYREK